MDYEEAKTRIKDFLKDYYVEDDDEMKFFKYANQIGKIARREQTAIIIDQDDVYQHDPELADWICGNTIRFRHLFNDIIDEMIHEFLGDKQPPVLDALDAFIFQRLYMDRKMKIANGEISSVDDFRKRYPADLMRRYEVYFKTRNELKPLAVRDLKAKFVGKLVRLRGVVIRCTEVKPMATVITYTCDTCSNEVFQPVTGMSFTPAMNCPSRECVESKANGRLDIQMRGSKFIKFQEIRIQELSDQVEVGSIPRSMTVYLSGENTRKCIPGDVIEVCGVLVPALRSGFRQMVGGLVTEVFLDAHNIKNNRNDSEEFLDLELTEEELEIVSEENFYEQLAYSIAPEIYGLTDVKKTLLLALVGGVNKNANGLKIRGALNILLMGDPGVAKSQLLTYVDRLSIRSQYTTGRGSSGVGLTAAVVKDPITGEMSLEGGSLVLADRGICCIDEFDKMTDSDRTAIHEVMEQQTISISKAGIITTLNARAAIIAAANPAYGRYNPHKSIEDNIRLPAALLSRFDVLWLIQDIPDLESDRKLADHITYVHRNCEQPKAAFNPVDMKLIRKYIAICKQKDPIVPDNLKDILVKKYVELRNEARNNVADSTFTSPRILLAVIRMCTALARIRLVDVVEQTDVQEALRLLDEAKNSLHVHKQQKDKAKDPVNRAFDVIRKMLIEAGKEMAVKIDKIYTMCERSGIHSTMVDECLYKRWRHLFLVDQQKNTVQITM